VVVVVVVRARHTLCGEGVVMCSALSASVKGTCRGACGVVVVVVGMRVVMVVEVVVRVMEVVMVVGGNKAHCAVEV
jgi:hypothetical protein